MDNPGTLALVGGAEWREGCSFDARLLAAAGTDQVLVLPTAAAYENPDRSVIAAQRWFSELGATATGLRVLKRTDAEDPANVASIRAAKFIYISDGSPMHLRSVIKDSSVWSALVEAWLGGATVAGSAAGATVLGDPMVDPRGGAFTIGLGLVRKLAVVPHWETWTGDRARRMTHLSPSNAVVAEIEEQTALIRWGDGTWEADGNGKVTLAIAKNPIRLDELEAAVETGALAVPVPEYP